MTETKKPDATDSLNSMVRQGKKVRIDYGNQGVPTKLYNIRSIVDEDQVVSRTWSNGRWIYEVNNMHWFDMHLRDGQLYPA